MQIVFLDAYSLGDADLSPLKALGQCVFYEETTPDLAAQRCRDADVVITNKVQMTREVMAAAPRLRLICVAATGTNNIDHEAAAQLGIAVRNVPGYSTDSVVETTLALALGLWRRVACYDRFVKSGAYARSGRVFHFGPSVHELHGKCWGIVGMGQIGRAVARVAEALGTRVVYCSTSGRNLSAGYPCLPLAELLQQADIVSVHALLNAATANLLDRDALRLMRPTAVLVNVARGGIVSEAAVTEALNSDRLAGYGADVFDGEPMSPDSPLLKVQDPDKLLLTPHYAWASTEARNRLVRTMAGHIEQLQQSL